MAQSLTSGYVEQAAHNNACWCDTICRAHGIPGEFHDRLWLNRQRAPRFYPNAVTLAKMQESTEQLAYIHQLIEALDSLAVKDSFCTLDLAPLAFRVLFEATWIWRAASLPKPDGTIAGVRWSSVDEPLDLARWETAWNGLPADDQSAPQPRIFLPSLLADTDTRFIAAYQGQRIVAGAIANRTERVVGVSNVFVPGDDSLRFWAGCVAAIMDAFPRLPLAGYERGGELAVAQALGFEGSGSLRIWVREGSTL